MGGPYVRICGLSLGELWQEDGDSHLWLLLLGELALLCFVPLEVFVRETDPGGMYRS